MEMYLESYQFTSCMVLEKEDICDSRLCKKSNKERGFSDFYV